MSVKVKHSETFCGVDDDVFGIDGSVILWWVPAVHVASLFCYLVMIVDVGSFRFFEYVQSTL